MTGGDKRYLKQIINQQDGTERRSESRNRGIYLDNYYENPLNQLMEIKKGTVVLIR